MGIIDTLKNKASNAKLKAQLLAAKKLMQKQGIPEAQQDMLFSAMEANPQLFEKIAKEIEQKKKEGKGEMAASMEVMRKYQGEIQKLFMNKTKKVKQ